MQDIRKQLNRHISSLTIIPFLLLFMIVCSIPIIRVIHTNVQASQPTEIDTRTEALPPEKTIAELEAEYAQNHNPKTLRGILRSMKPITAEEYEKKLALYAELWKLDTSTFAIDQLGYTATLYSAGKKQDYYAAVNSLLLDEAYMKNKTILPKDKAMKTLVLLSPIMNDSSATSTEYDFALSKLLPYDHPEKLAKEQNFYLYYFPLCKLYYKMGNESKVSFYQDVISAQYEKEFGPKFWKWKKKMLADLNSYLTA